MQQDKKLQQLQTNSDSRIEELEQGLAKVQEERNRMEQESMTRLMNSAEKELELNQNYDEVRRLKSELIDVHEHVRVIEKDKQELQVSKSFLYYPIIIFSIVTVYLQKS